MTIAGVAANNADANKEDDIYDNDDDDNKGNKGNETLHNLNNNQPLCWWWTAECDAMRVRAMDDNSGRG